MSWRGCIHKRLFAMAVCLWPAALEAGVLTIGAAAPAVGGGEGLRVVIDSLYVEDGALRVDFHADSAMTAKVLEGLRRGLTASITYHLQVWHKRWIRDLVAERRLEWKASFDNWEQKFIVVGLGERRMTASVARVREKWATQRSLQLVDVSRLQPGRNYYVVIEAFLEPVSKENLREIRGWLAGKVRSGAKAIANADSVAVDSVASASKAPADSSSERPGFKLRVLDTLMNLIGFGGKKAGTRSELFQIEENVILWPQ